MNTGNSIVIYKSQRQRIIDEFVAEHPWIYALGNKLTYTPVNNKTI